MPAVLLAAYTTPDGVDRELRAVAAGDSPRPVVRGPEARAPLAARLRTGPALVPDVAVGPEPDPRMVAELDAGEGLAAVDAVVADYLPRARRASRPLAPTLLAAAPVAEAA